MAKDPNAAYPEHSLAPSLLDARASDYDRVAAFHADPDFQRLPPASQQAVPRALRTERSESIRRDAKPGIDFDHMPPPPRRGLCRPHRLQAWPHHVCTRTL